jgi:putative (di)nucleoside polyphosphate hydrolase
LVVLNGHGHVLVLERSDVAGSWQLPQGGLEPDEEPEEAAWRELMEETRLGKGHVSLTRVSDFWIGYELPNEMRSSKTGRGQVHKWFCFDLKAGSDLPPLPDAPGSEFVASRWVTFTELVASAIDFRQPTYRVVSAWLADRLGD